MKINYDKLLYISAAIYFVSLSVMYYFFNVTALMWPLFVVFIIAGVVMHWSSGSLMTSPLKDLENSQEYKKLSTNEEWIIAVLALVGMGFMIYADIRAYIGGPILVTLVVLTVRFLGGRKEL